MCFRRLQRARDCGDQLLNTYGPSPLMGSSGALCVGRWNIITGVARKSLLNIYFTLPNAAVLSTSYLLGLWDR